MAGHLALCIPTHYTVTYLSWYPNTAHSPLLSSFRKPLQNDNYADLKALQTTVPGQ